MNDLWRRIPNVVKFLAFFAFGIYCGIYREKSIRGRYVITVYSLTGPKGYDWAPSGFEDEGIGGNRIDRKVYFLFAPLYWADKTLWHNSSKIGAEGYPVEPFDLKFKISKPASAQTGDQAVRREVPSEK
ncbi:MAG TPA: hypothetical protein VG796_20945 [Verrucomicrobiales bacterium]|nr:hypothetical protein [Verrucomicrobiales bacterium]